MRVTHNEIGIAKNHLSMLIDEGIKGCLIPLFGAPDELLLHNGRSSRCRVGLLTLHRWYDSGSQIWKFALTPTPLLRRGKTPQESPDTFQFGTRRDRLRVRVGRRDV